MRKNLIGKKIIALFLSAVILLSGAFPAGAAQSKKYKDVKQTDWYYDAVNEMTEKKVFSGTSVNTFEPNKNMTRAMFVQTLYNLVEEKDYMLLGYEDNGGDMFKDVRKGAWYYDAVQWAGATAMAEGMGDGKFSPHSPITREQAVKLLFGFNLGTGNKTLYSSEALINYVDDNVVSAWAEFSMKWAVQSKIIQGVSENRLSPKTFLTRAQAAKLLQNIYPLLDNKKLLPASPAQEAPAVPLKDYFGTSDADMNIDLVPDGEHIGARSYRVESYPGYTFHFSQEEAGKGEYLLYRIDGSTKDLFPQLIGKTVGEAGEILHQNPRYGTESRNMLYFAEDLMFFISSDQKMIIAEQSIVSVLKENAAL